MGVQVAEARGEVPMLNRRDVLVLEEDDLVLEQCRADLRDEFVAGIPGEIHIADDGADGGGQRRNSRTGHGEVSGWLRLSRAGPRAPSRFCCREGGSHLPNISVQVRRPMLHRDKFTDKMSVDGLDRSFEGEKGAELLDIQKVLPPMRNWHFS